MLDRNTLYNNLIDNIELLEDTNKEDNRDYEHVKRVIDFFFKPQFVKYAKKDETRKDKLLFNYTFFLQSTPQFQYNWSYLRKKINLFSDFLVEFNDFLDLFISDYNSYLKRFESYTDVIIKINEYLIIEFTSRGVPNFSIDVTQVDSLISKSSSSQYFVEIWMNTGIFTSFTRKKTDDLEQNITESLQLLNNR